jgi:catechol 2,3-dioxygenase-like lactoylglutathione lyase family enzyme
MTGPGPAPGAIRVEHLAVAVDDPAAFAAWYEGNLGCAQIREAVDDQGQPTRFLRLPGGQMLLEVLRDQALASGFAGISFRRLHLAFHVDDVATTLRALVAAGATMEAKPITTPAGDELAMVRDPWGMPVQLVRRNRPFED